MTTEQFLKDAFEAASPFGPLATLLLRRVLIGDTRPSVGETGAFGTFKRLREESGRVVTPDVKRAAFEQVLLYWRRLRTLAEQVTETEVHLVLPDQRSPEGRRYTLEGVVDIVREHDETVMYDVKTYLDAEAAQADIDPHFKQLNVYAHIWQTLRGPLDEAAMVARWSPLALRHALGTIDSVRIQAATGRHWGGTRRLEA